MKLKYQPANRTALYALLSCVVCLSLLGVALAYSAINGRKPDLLNETRRALETGAWNDAVGRIRARECSDDLDPEIPPARLALVQFARRTNDQTLCRQVAKELTDRYGYSAAGIAARRIVKELEGGEDDAKWHRNYQLLRSTLRTGARELEQEQLEALFGRARQDFLQDKDPCGTCRWEKKHSRENCILLASVLGQRPSAFADWAWRTMATDGFADSGTILFTLIRQYETAGQRADLARLWEELETRAKKRAESAASDDLGNQKTQATMVSAHSASVRESLALLSADCDAWLATFERTTKDDPGQPLWSASLPRNVAAWLLLRDYAATTEKIVAAAQSGEYHVHRLAELLVLINSPAAIDGLRKLIDLPDEQDRAAVCRVIPSRMTEPDDLILEAVVKGGHKLEGVVEGPPRLEMEFLRPWPPAGRNSMPKELPWDLFDRDA